MKTSIRYLICINVAFREQMAANSRWGLEWPDFVPGDLIIQRFTSKPFSDCETRFADKVVDKMRWHQHNIQDIFGEKKTQERIQEWYVQGTGILLLNVVMVPHQGATCGNRKSKLYGEIWRGKLDEMKTLSLTSNCFHPENSFFREENIHLRISVI